MMTKFYPFDVVDVVVVALYDVSPACVVNVRAQLCDV